MSHPGTAPKMEETLNKVMEAAQTIVNVVELVKTTTVNEDSFKGKAATTKGLEDANTESKGKAATAKGLEDANTESKAQRQLYAQYSSLQLKLDKVVRHLDAISERQASMNKMLQSLLKAKHSDTSKSKSKRRASAEDMNGEASEPKQQKSIQPDHPAEWACNLVLVGDEHWQRLREIDDLEVEIGRLEKECNFRIISKRKETVAGLYDEKRSKVLFALPPTATKVAISVGTSDIHDEELMTLRDASLEEVRRKNAPVLKTKISHLIQLFTYLINQEKMVILLLPPLGEDRIEVHDHWEELLIRETKSIPSKDFKIINLPSVMRSTLFHPHYESMHLWLEKPGSSNETSRTILTAYGCRRLFDLLEKTADSRPVTSRTSGNQCLRCLREHPGFEDSCKSRYKACRRCQGVGHFEQVHDVTDPQLRSRIEGFLGVPL